MCWTARAIAFVFLDIDRDKAQILAVPLNAVFQALQASLGGFYVTSICLAGGGRFRSRRRQRIAIGLMTFTGSMCATTKAE